MDRNGDPVHLKAKSSHKRKKKIKVLRPKMHLKGVGVSGGGAPTLLRAYKKTLTNVKGCSRDGMPKTMQTR